MFQFWYPQYDRRNDRVEMGQTVMTGQEVCRLAQNIVGRPNVPINHALNVVRDYYRAESVHRLGHH